MPDIPDWVWVLALAALVLGGIALHFSPKTLSAAKARTLILADGWVKEAADSMINDKLKLRVVRRERRKDEERIPGYVIELWTVHNGANRTLRYSLSMMRNWRGSTPDEDGIITTVAATLGRPVA